MAPFGGVMQLHSRAKNTEEVVSPYLITSVEILLLIKAQCLLLQNVALHICF